MYPQSIFNLICKAGFRHVIVKMVTSSLKQAQIMLGKQAKTSFFFFHALSSFQEALYPNWREIMFYMQLVKEGKNEKFLSSSLH